MTKPKNSDPNACDCACYESGYSAGLVAGEKRLGRALLKWIGLNTNVENADFYAIKDWLTAWLSGKK